jgi:hypothetical protein
MIDGDQVAYFDSQGRIVSGTKRFRYQAKAPASIMQRSGLYMDFQFPVDGQIGHGGIQVADLTIEYRFDGTGPDAKQYVFVDEVKPIDGTFRYALPGKDSEDSTTISQAFLTDGHVVMKIAALPGSPKDQWYTTELAQPLHGSLRVLDKPPTRTDSQILPVVAR